MLKVLLFLSLNCFSSGIEESKIPCRILKYQKPMDLLYDLKYWQTKEGSHLKHHLDHHRRVRRKHGQEI